MAGTLHLLCGLPATGKTTLARSLEDRGAVRLTLDEWLLGLYGRADLTSGRTPEAHRAHFRDRLERVHARLEPLAERLLRLGVDVVLDFGLWTRAERDRLRALAGRVPQARARLHLLEAPLPELARRLEARNRALPADQFAITPEMLEAFAERFERPGLDEPHERASQEPLVLQADEEARARAGERPAVRTCRGRAASGQPCRRGWLPASWGDR